MIDYIMDVIGGIFNWLDYYLALFTIAIPENKNPLVKFFND
jgi:hypothetical protein